MAVKGGVFCADAPAPMSGQLAVGAPIATPGVVLDIVPLMPVMDAPPRFSSLELICSVSPGSASPSPSPNGGGSVNVVVRWCSRDPP